MRIVILFLSILIGNIALAAAPVLPTVQYVDVGRYIGRWYVITTLPQFFTKSCIGQIAEYQILTKDSISVLNTCIKKNKKTSNIKGKAVVSNPRTNAELIVTFDSFFTKLFNVKGDYNIIALDPSYEFVMVGSRDRKSLWIMSRKTGMPDNILRNYINLARSLKFDVSKLQPSKY